MYNCLCMSCKLLLKFNSDLVTSVQIKWSEKWKTYTCLSIKTKKANVISIEFVY